MEHVKKILVNGAAQLLLLGLAGCYYPVYPAYTYGYPPAQQTYPAANSGQECREYTKSATIDGKKQQITGTACLQPDGTWQDASNGAVVSPPPISPAVAAVPPPPPAYYYPPPVYYTEPPYPYVEPVVVGGGFYVGGGGYRHWR